MAKLVLKFKGQTLKEIPFKGKAITVGRDSGNDIKIDNPAVSGIHARIIRDGESVFIEDAESTNGTFLNGEKITRSVLNSTDEVAIGKHHIKFFDDENGSADEQEDDEPITPITPSLDKTMVMGTKARMVAQGKTGGFVILDGEIEVSRVELTDRVSTIGKSSDAVIKTKGLFASKVAALINKTDKGYVITPSDPKKAPLINRKECDEPYILKDDDIVEIGGLKLRFFLN